MTGQGEDYNKDGWLKNTDGKNADGIQSMFTLTDLEKIKKPRPKCSQGKLLLLQKMGKYYEQKFKLAISQLKN